MEVVTKGENAAIYFPLYHVTGTSLKGCPPFMKTDDIEWKCHKRQQIDMPRELLCSVGHGQQYSISGDELCLFVAR